MVSEKLQKLIDRFDGKCHLCGGSVVCDDKDHPGFPSRDHIKPRSQLVENEEGQLALAHRICNSYRGDLHIGKCVTTKERDRFIKKYNRSVWEYEETKKLVNGVYSVG